MFKERGTVNQATLYKTISATRLNKNPQILRVARGNPLRLVTEDTICNRAITKAMSDIID